MPNAGILGIVVGKLYHEKNLCPIILLKVNERSKISFHYIILPFGLTVYLWVEGGREALLDTKEIA